MFLGWSQNSRVQKYSKIPNRYQPRQIKQIICADIKTWQCECRERTSKVNCLDQTLPVHGQTGWELLHSNN